MKAAKNVRRSKKDPLPKTADAAASAGPTKVKANFRKLSADAKTKMVMKVAATGKSLDPASIYREWRTADGKVIRRYYDPNTGNYDALNPP